MLVYKGKYTVAKVMIDVVEEEMVKQMYGFLNHPAFEGMNIVVMPDCHAGKGAVVGFTATMNDYIIPNIVGVDIGCGVLAIDLGKREVDLPALDKFIREHIPSGHSVNASPLLLLWNEWNRGRTLDTFISQLHDICTKVGSDFHRAGCSIGSLGGGNHFIELDKDPDGHIWLLVHSGSRKFGLDVANYHQQKAKELMREMFIGAAYKDLEFLPIDHGGKEYLEDMRFAQQFAKENRYYIIRRIAHEFFEASLSVPVIESVHNYIGTDNIIRKGAISAYENELVVIPLNMRDGTIVAAGKKNKDWNYSAPHGAGRILSRKKAKAQLSVEMFTEEMKDIWTSCVSKDTLDESPMAYKDKELIIKAIEETVDIKFIMKPIYNFKASE